jgi:methionyl-tRNA formyltransferase
LKETLEYPYANGPLLEDRNTYFYSSYGGPAFLQAWRRSRMEVCKELPAPVSPPTAEIRWSPEAGEDLETATMLEWLWALLPEYPGEINPKARHFLNGLLQRFEISKRIHSAYTQSGKPKKGASYREMALYIRFAEVLNKAFVVSASLPYLNGLLKCMDTLCALWRELDGNLPGRLARLVREEQVFISQLAEEREGASHAHHIPE